MPGPRKKLTHGVKWIHGSCGDLREKNKERQGNKPSTHLCFSYPWTMVIDQSEDPLCGGT